MPLTVTRPVSGRPFALLACLGALAVAGCANTDGFSRVDEPGTPVKADRAPQRDADEAALKAQQIHYKRVADVENERGCTIKNAVEVTGVGDVKFTRPALLTMDMAERLGRWVNDVAKPESGKILKKQLAAIDVYGSYSCRNAYGRPFGGRVSGRLSQHAHANAIDIGGFVFSDGSKVEYKKNWKGASDSRTYIHNVSLKGCNLFATTLTPDYDRYHWHHIHFDASPRNNLCGYAGKFDRKAAAAWIPRAAPAKAVKKPVKKAPVTKAPAKPAAPKAVIQKS
jgi:hypothetical protein